MDADSLKNAEQQVIEIYSLRRGHTIVVFDNFASICSCGRYLGTIPDLRNPKCVVCAGHNTRYEQTLEDFLCGRCFKDYIDWIKAGNDILMPSDFLREMMHRELSYESVRISY